MCFEKNYADFFVSTFHGEVPRKSASFKVAGVDSRAKAFFSIPTVPFIEFSCLQHFKG